MSWWVIEQVSVNEAGTQTLANIQCDDVSDLPAPDQSATLGYVIVRGSQAKVLVTSENYILGSTGTWVKMEDGVKLDLTGYATEQYVDDGLADKVDTSVYSSGQAAQDARIDQLVGIGMQIPENADLNTYVDGGVYQILSSAIAQTLLNIPTTCKVAGSIEVKVLNGSARIQFYYPNWASSGSTVGGFFFRQRTGTTNWSSWYSFVGVQV